MTNLRRAAAGDIPRLLELLIQVNLIHHRLRPDLFKGPATKYSASELEALLGDETRPIFVCTDETDRVLGYCFCVEQDRPETPLTHRAHSLYIDDLCVDEACRGRGLGEALYRRALAYARERGCQSVTLNVWAGNEAARGFYERMGMEARNTTMEAKL